MLELIGKPKSEDIDSLESPVANNILSSINVTKKKSFNAFFQGTDDVTLDLLKKLLAFNPSHRLTVE